ncbi:hypothetical protein L0P88_03935 [Muricauda sp. SCSIO 64092]|uniref:hypothetical protein n=1 Tax=Allomuricauda sp. SCSIO 64092 TaxID=2908842 RepID=UPI001FF5977A|nr:hypothetical protein [Muricauda sp. SCSIO 64092]UOY07704.1 hypothetical protein L0P88_03935 [Muricauda sp. SCSIO 64092]
MPKKIVDETLKFEVIINGDKAQKEFGQLERATKKLIDRNEDLEKQAKKLEKSRKDNREAIKKLRDEIDRNNKTIQGNEARMKELTKEIGLNNLSMRQLGREARKLNGILSNLDPNTEEWQQYNKELKAVKGRMSELREEMKPVNESLDDNMELWGGMSAAVGQFFFALNSGDAQAAKAALLSIVELLKNAGKASLAFIATPIGAFIAVLAGIGLAAKEWFNYNNQARQAIILTQEITRLQGEQANAARLQARAISDTFNVDFVETLKTAKVLAKQFNISFTEALEEIEQGLINGQRNNTEFFDSLREYPTFFASAGFSVSEFRKTVEAGYDLGIYQDKLPDAIKEVDLSLREQTKSTVEALENAFGAAFTKRILNQVKNGEITTKEALIEIAKEAEKTGLNVQQNAQLTADLFRGAGEDAGGAIVVLDAFNTALGETEEALSPLEEMIKEVAEANQELAKAQDEALRSENYVAMANEVELFWIKVKTGFFQGIKFITDQFSKFNEWFLKFTASNIATIANFPSVVRESFSEIKNSLGNLGRSFMGLGSIIKKVMTGNFEAAREEFKDSKELWEHEIENLTSTGSEALKKISKIREKASEFVGKELEKRRKAAAAQIELEQNGGSQPKEGDRKTINGIQYIFKNGQWVRVKTGGGGKGDDELTAEDKKILNSKKRLGQLLDDFEAERKLQEELKKVEESQRAEEEEILKIEQKFKKLEEQAAGDSELLSRLEAEKQAQIQDVRDKYADIQLEKDKELRKKLDDASKKFQESQIEAETKLAQAKANAQQAGLNILKRVFGESSALGKAIFAIQKALAIKGIIAETAKANAMVMSNLAIANAKALAAFPLTSGQPWILTNTTAAKATLAANNAASKINIATIAAETVAGMAGFEDGLYPVKRHDGKKFNARFGGAPTTQIVGSPTTFLAGEMPEMIIDPKTFKQMDPAITDYILHLAGKPTPGFESGMYPAGGHQNEDLLQKVNTTIAQLNETISKGVIGHIHWGFDAARNQQQMEERLRKIRNNAKVDQNAV